MHNSSNKIIKFLFKYQNWLLIILIVLLAFLTRFYNFENRINFGPEQARSLIVAGNNIVDKWSFLGQELYRTTSEGHILFSSALFSYSLVPLLLIFNFDPTKITGYFAVLNLLTGVILFFVVKRIFNFRIAFFSLILFLFSYLMIYHSMFIWIANYLPLVGVVTLYLLSKLSGKPQNYTKYLLDILLVGIVSGIGIGLEYAYILTAVLIGVYLLWKSKFNIVGFLLFGLGTVLGTFPIFIFDLKHNFYHLSTLLNFVTSGEGVGFVYYHYLHFIVVLVILGGFLLTKIYQKNKYAALVILLIYLVLNLSSSQLSFTKAIGMSDNFNIKDWYDAASTIANDEPKLFNVAALLDYDSQAHPLRYLLKFKYNKVPEDVEDYPKAGTLYVLTGSNYDFSKAIAWEVISYRPFQVAKLAVVNGNYAVFKLVK